VVIKVNGEPINFTLEKESSLSDVVREVRRWAGGGGFVVTAALMGGRDLLSVPAAEWESMPIASVKELAFRVSSTTDVRIEHWAAVRSWMGLLAREIASPGASLDELAAGIPATLSSIGKNPFMPARSQEMERFAALCEGLDASAIRQWPRETREEAAGLLARLGAALDARIKAASNPQEALKDRLPRLRELQAAIPDVPLFLQTGKDRQAMDIVTDFTELFQKLLDIVPFLPKDGERDRVFEELNPILRQILQAFDARDFVLIGDLFEYEVAPRLGRLAPLLEKHL
jgi:hypothetical protein